MMLTAYFESPAAPALPRLLDEWHGAHPAGGCLALVAEASKAQLPTLQASFREGGYPLAGALFPELIVNDSFRKEGVVLLHLSTMPLIQLIGALPEDDNELNAALAPLSAQIAQHSTKSGEDALFLIFDGMVPNIATVLERLYLQLANQVHYFGVNAGSESFQPMPCLFDGERLLGGGLLALLLPNHPGAQLTHDYRRPKQQLTATASSGNRISSINWRPAFEVYQELIQEQYGITITAENFYQYGVHFPFGIIRMDGEPLVRIPVALNEDGSLYCVGEVPPNTMLQLLHAIEPGSMQSVDAIAARQQLQRGETLLSFYCAGRRMHLGDAANTELAALHARFADNPITGALTLGEIGTSSSGGYPLFHNATLVTLPWR